MRRTMLSIIRNSDSSVAAFLRKKLLNTPCMIDTHVYITNSTNFYAGIETALYHGCYILNSNGTFRMGNHSHLGAYCYVNVCYGNVNIGDGVAIGPGTKIIAYSNHYAKGKKVIDEYATGDIYIGNNVLIGANCSILPGTRIEDNVVVGAGAVVKGTLETNTIYAGVPCSKIISGWYQ